MSPPDPPDPIIESIAAEALSVFDRNPVQLAFWPDDERAMPGDFIACALFTASKVTTHVTRCKLASVRGLSVIFTGKRLTQVHADVWMGIMHLAREKSSGDVVRFRTRELLGLIGRHTHPAQREQLKGWISELASTQVLIQDDANKRRFGGSLLPWQEETDGDYFDVFRVTISRQLAELLEGKRHHQIDWPLRRALQKKPLALWLQTFFARYGQPDRVVRVKHLHALAGSTSTLKKFRQNLQLALSDLTAAGGYPAAIDRETDTVRAIERPPVRTRRLPPPDTQENLFEPVRLVR